MHKYLAKHIQEIPRSGIRDFFELVQGRDDVISLGVGEPDFPAPWHVREAAIFSLERGQTSYTSNLGMPKLRQRIAEYCQEFFQVGYEAQSEVLVTVGVSEAIDLALRALINPGDEVLYHEPCYVSYLPSITLAYGKAVAVATRAEDGFALKADALREKITPQSKLLILNFPTNPTGGVVPRAELEKIAQLCVEHDLIVLSDEIYAELRWQEQHVSIASLPGMRERTVLLHGFSKAFAMTGFRLGYACAPAELIEAMMKIHQYSMLCAPITSQVAALEALEHGAEAMERMRSEYQRRLHYLLGRLAEAGLEVVRPGGTFYTFVDIRRFGLTSQQFALGLLEKHAVAAVPGSAFGPSGEGFLRCCFATGMPALEQATERIKHYVQSLDKQ